MRLVGFTGTSRGMTEDQARKVYQLTRDVAVAHLGDCVGFDAEVHAMLPRTCWTVGHPPDIERARAHCMYSEVWLPSKYLIRNHDIVDSSKELIAGPRLMMEELRSGTWATVRYARKKHRRIIIIWPDGSTRVENP